jgi:hypothetical protein
VFQKNKFILNDSVIRLLITMDLYMKVIFPKQNYILNLKLKSEYIGNVNEGKLMKNGRD